MLLYYIRDRLEYEIQSGLSNPSQSQILELLYLFNDFIIRDYPRIGVGEEIQKIWSIDWASNSSFRDKRREKDAIYFEDVLLDPDNNPTNKENYFCHEWFGKDQWHDISVENI